MCESGAHERHHDAVRTGGCEQPHHEHHDCGCGEHHHGHHDGGYRGRHRRSEPYGPCCCGDYGEGPRSRTFWRRFSTKEERIAWLEAYLADLRAEAQAVEEHIAEMKAEA